MKAPMPERLTVEEAACKLDQADDGPFIRLFRHGSLEVEFYRPERVDLQQPHSRDEVYVVISGSGHFVNGDTRKPFSSGEVLFVPAGVEHRFEDFTDDFATWVFFYGPKGGEANKE